MANRFWVGGNGNWDATAGSKWATTSGGSGGAAVPTAADDVFLDNGAGTGNVTITANAACRSLNCNGYTGTLTHNSSVTVSIGDSTSGASNVALKLAGTYTRLGGSTSIFKFVSTSTTQQSIDCANKTLGSLVWDGVGGNWILSSGFSSSGNHVLTNGTLNVNGQTITAGSFQSTNANTRTLTLGAANITLSGSFNGVWSLADSSGLTFSGTSATITCTGSAVGEVFRGGGQSYGTVNLTGSGNVTIAGANTFGTLTRSNASACALILPAGLTQTITGSLQASGTSGNLVTLQSSSAGTAATLSKTSGIVSCDYLSLKDSTAAGGAAWYAGRNSVDVSGNSGWVFAAYFSAAATLSAASSIASTGARLPATVTGSAALTASTAITTIGREQVARSVTLTTTATIATVGARLAATVSRSAALDASTGIATTRSLIRLRSATLAAATLIATDSGPIRLRSASITALTGVASTATATRYRSAALDATGVIASAWSPLARPADLVISVAPDADMALGTSSPTTTLDTEATEVELQTA